MKNSGLMKVRTMAPVTRRGFNLGALAAASSAALGAGFGAGSARAAGEVVFLGWQGYDEALFVGGFMEEKASSSRRPTSATTTRSSPSCGPAASAPSIS